MVEAELAGGLAVQDYSHLYKSFYDIFVGQILEPKTFDLAFVVRDTRNTYAQFVSLMSIDKKKYHFDQAPLEKSLHDFMPSIFQITGQSSSDLMMHAMAQAELKDRYQNLIKHKDVNEIVKDASLKAALPPSSGE